MRHSTFTSVEARPDEKMSRRHRECLRVGYFQAKTSYRRALKKVTNARRRRRDHFLP